MHTTPASAIRRRVIFLCLLTFLLGLIVGCLGGVFGMRHLYHYFRPTPEEIARDRAVRISRDLGLSPEVQERIYQENIRHFADFTERFRVMHDAIDQDMERYAREVARVLPDDATRERWLTSFRKYFPRKPPPGPPPPGPPPLGGPPMGEED